MVFEVKIKIEKIDVTLIVFCPYILSMYLSIFGVDKLLNGSFKKMQNLWKCHSSTSMRVQFDQITNYHLHLKHKEKKVNENETRPKF